MLGLLALLLGFTFSMGLQRFDARGEAAIHEANAIGTAYLRTELITESDGEPLRALMRDYLSLRIDATHVDLTQTDHRLELNARTLGLQAAIWPRAVDAAERDPRPVTTGLLLQALNEMIDACSSRQAALAKRVPEVVTMLLFAVLAITGAVLGFASGLEGGRPKLATVSIAALILLVIFLIIDLDRPRRGLIQVDQSSLEELGELVNRGVFDPTSRPSDAP